jgi:hypothetical protein
VTTPTASDLLHAAGMQRDCSGPVLLLAQRLADALAEVERMRAENALSDATRIARAIEAEREACADIASDARFQADAGNDDRRFQTAYEIACAIRARGAKPGEGEP